MSKISVTTTGRDAIVRRLDGDDSSIIAHAKFYPAIDGMNHREGWYVSPVYWGLDQKDLHMYGNIAGELNKGRTEFTIDTGEENDAASNAPAPKRRGRPRKTDNTEESNDE